MGHTQGLAIYRKEHGYAGLKGIGVATDGTIRLLHDGDIEPPVNAIGRYIDNPGVEGALSAPIKVFFDPTRICPLHCKFCLASAWSPAQGRRSEGELSTKQAVWVAHELARAGVLKVKIGGGEPFLYPAFWDIIAELRNAGVFVSTSTSGVSLLSLTSEQARYLAKQHVKTSVSIDGDPTFHDRARGFLGLFDKALSGIYRLRAEGAKVEIRSTLFDIERAEEQIEFLDQLSQRNQIRVRLRMEKPSQALTGRLGAFMKPSPEYWRVYDAMKNASQSNPFIETQDMAYYCQHDFSRFGQGLDCAAGTRSAFVNYRGVMSPCGFIDFRFPGDQLVGSDRSFLTIWQNGDSFKAVRNYFWKENTASGCADCGHKNTCQGGCPSIRLRLGLEKDPRCPMERQNCTQQPDLYSKLEDLALAQ